MADRTMSKAHDIFADLAYPFRTATALLALVTFYLLSELALLGGVLGIFLILLLVPAISRYLMQLLEARARGREVAPPDIALFGFFSEAWSLFPLVLGAGSAAIGYALAARVGQPPAVGLALLATGLLPASLGVLAITHSPLQCVDPRRLAAFIGRCGASYWLLPFVIGAAGLLAALLEQNKVPGVLLRLAAWCATFGLFAAIGAVLRVNKLADDISIPEPVPATREDREEAVTQDRRKTLTHAYGFASRGNRRGGLQHIFDWLEQDPDPDAAWSWFFAELMDWEDTTAALEFAQHYLSRLLRQNKQVAAVKVLLRCCDVNPRFRPFPQDRELAVQAAENCKNAELQRMLRS